MQLVKSFLEQLLLDGRSINTASSYATDLKLFFDFCKTDDPKKITAKMFVAYDAQLQAGKGHNTRVRRRTGIKSFWNFLSAQHGFENMAEKIFKPLNPRISDPRLLQPEDITVILHATEETNPTQARDGAIITFLAATGVRRDELRNLKMNHISLHPEATHFIAQVPQNKPEGSFRIVNFGNLKQTGDIVKLHFGLWFAYRISNFGGASSAGNLPLFSALRTPEKKLSKVSINEIVKKAGLRTNLPRLTALHPHAFRHYCLTRWAENGMDLINIQAYAGHKDIKSTTRYIHLAEKRTAHQALLKSSTHGLKSKPTLIIDHKLDPLLILQQVIPRTQI